MVRVRVGFRVRFMVRLWGWVRLGFRYRVLGCRKCTQGEARPAW